MGLKRRYRVFFIEDEPAIIELYTSAFAGSGFDMRSVTSGKEALKKLVSFKNGTEQKPDVIIADVLLPDISGLEILKEIRRSKEFDLIPVVILTNYGTNEITETVRHTPNTRHVLKMETSPVLFVTQIQEMVQLS